MKYLNKKDREVIITCLQKELQAIEDWKKISSNKRYGIPLINHIEKILSKIRAS